MPTWLAFVLGTGLGLGLACLLWCAINSTRGGKK